MSAGSRASLAAIVLAAGASRRMGSPKAALPVGDATMLGRVLLALGDGWGAAMVVVGSPHEDAVAAAIPAGSTVRVVVNPAPERGQLSSLKVGLRHVLASAPRVRGAVVALADHPSVRAETIDTLVAAACDGSHPIVLPTHGGRRGHPIVLLRPVWDELLSTPDTGSARVVVRRDSTRVCEVPVPDAGILLDVDTPSDLAALGAGPRDD
jgi:molybdenum cofactor cytidylyltransferase